MKSNPSRTLFRTLFATGLLAAGLCSCCPKHNTLTQAEIADGWQLLFDGKSLDQWKDFNGDSLTMPWHVVDGCIPAAGAGQGRTPSHEKIDIDIPAGVSTGRQLRVSGFGEAGLRGEPSGDLIVNVRVADHERFKRNGDDLYLLSDISIAQAALGCEIEVEGIMPDEVVKVTVPAGAQYGDTVSVNNYGMPRIGGGGSRGRLIVQLRVVVPTNLSNKQRELLRAFADEMGDDVASGKKSVTDRIKSALDDILD